jgi:hypothetical protein
VTRHNSSYDAVDSPVKLGSCFAVKVVKAR